MQKVWTQAARPRLSCQTLSRRETAATVLSRRTTSAPRRKRLTFQDAFTILLAPVLATAFIADTSWKDRRRKEWDEKIAKVVAEIDQLQERERRAWSALQERSIRIGATQQRRFYATAAHAIMEVPDPDDILLAPGLQVPDHWNDMIESRFHDQEVSTTVQEADDEAIQILKQHQRLVAVKLAVKLILHLHYGGSPRFSDINVTHHVDERVGVPQDAPALAKKLAQIKKSLWELRNMRPRRNVLRPPSPEQLQLDSRLAELSHSFSKNRLTVPSYVTNLAKAILESTESPTAEGYIAIMQALSRADLEDLSYRVIHAVEEGKVPLKSWTLYRILRQFGKHKDARGFERFLKNLTRLDRHLDPICAWEWWRINNTQVPIPQVRHPGVFQALIYTSLRLDQPHMAEAWVAVLREKDFDQRYKPSILNSFLRYYSSRLDWRQGKIWLNTALAWALSIAEISAISLPAVVLAMLDLCVACGKREVYSRIIELAASTQIGVYEPDPQRVVKLTPRSNAILREWAGLHEKAKSPEAEMCSYAARVQQFQEALNETFSKLLHSNESAGYNSSIPIEAQGTPRRTSSFADSDSAALVTKNENWEAKYQTQQAELMKVQSELSSARWEREQMRKDIKALRESLQQQSLQHRVPSPPQETNAIVEPASEHVQRPEQPKMAPAASPPPTLLAPDTLSNPRQKMRKDIGQQMPEGPASSSTRLELG